VGRCETSQLCLSLKKRSGIAAGEPNVSRPCDEEDDYDDRWEDDRRLKPHRGLMILLLGVFGLKTCGILGIVAFILARNDLAEMDAGRMDRSGRGMTQAGYILGIVGGVIACLVLALMTLYIGAIALTAMR
jgi:hypothetical protein